MNDWLYRGAGFLRQQSLPARNALTAYWPLICLLQACALAVLLSYYWIEGASEFFEAVAGWKAAGGLALVAATTVVSGGVLPEIFKRFFRPDGVSAPTFGELMHQFVMWAILGVLVDGLYRLQSRLFGESSDLLAVLSKVAFDQLLFTPLVTLSFIVSWFMLFEARYGPKRWLLGLRLTNLRDRILPLWFMSLCYWPVMLLIIYSLPLALQFPLFLFSNAAFSVLMIFVARRQVLGER